MIIREGVKAKLVNLDTLLTKPALDFWSPFLGQVGTVIEDVDLSKNLHIEIELPGCTDLFPAHPNEIEIVPA